MTNSEMLESQEAIGLEDIKEGLKNLRDKVAPYYTPNKKAKDLYNFIYKKSGEKKEKSNLLIKDKKEAILSYKNKNGDICNITVNRETIGRWYKQSISVNTGNKYLCINWKFMKPSESDGRGNSDHFYLTDKNGNILEDNLEPKKAEKVLNHIQGMVSEYQQYSDRKLAELMN